MHCIKTEHPLYRNRTSSYFSSAQVLVNHYDQKLAYSSHWTQQISHVKIKIERPVTLPQTGSFNKLVKLKSV